MSRCMRTTLTIDDDVAAAIERLRRGRDASLKEIVNKALRRGIKEMSTPRKASQTFRTRSIRLGNLQVPSLDNIAEVLAVAEGEAFK
jgi:Arc/MetJ family transcription regulator